MTEISILKTLIDNKGYCPKAMSCRDCLIVDSVCRKASVLMMGMNWIRLGEIVEKATGEMTDLISIKTCKCKSKYNIWFCKSKYE